MAPCLHNNTPRFREPNGFGWLAEPGALAAGVGSNPGFNSRLSPGFIPKKILQPLSRGTTRRLLLRSRGGSGDLKKDAVFISACSCRSDCVRVVCVVCVVCVGVCSYMNRFYSCTQSRG